MRVKATPKQECSLLRTLHYKPLPGQTILIDCPIHGKHKFSEKGALPLKLPNGKTQVL